MVANLVLTLDWYWTYGPQSLCLWLSLIVHWLIRSTIALFWSLPQFQWFQTIMINKTQVSISVTIIYPLYNPCKHSQEIQNAAVSICSMIEKSVFISLLPGLVIVWGSIMVINGSNTSSVSLWSWTTNSLFAYRLPTNHSLYYWCWFICVILLIIRLICNSTSKCFEIYFHILAQSSSVKISLNILNT